MRQTKFASPDDEVVGHHDSLRIHVKKYKGNIQNKRTVSGPRNTENELMTVKKTLVPVRSFHGHIAIPSAAVINAPL